MDFSMMCPIKNEVNLIPYTLPSFYAIKPSEIILCFDNPPDEKALLTAKKISERYRDIKTLFVFVSRDNSYHFHQALVRRSGFMMAKNDIILTVDIDTILDTNVTKFFDLIGKNGVMLVSFAKISYPISHRYLIARLIQTFYKHKSFTGLYAFSKKAWLETEDINSLKKIPRGEDTHLHQSIIKRYRDAFVPSTKNIVLRPKESKTYQMLMGFNRWNIRRTSLVKVLISSFLYFRPYMLFGYLKARFS
jgi:hypothetical protein